MLVLFICSSPDTPADTNYWPVCRFPRSNLHQRDPRASSSLFDSYGGGSRPASKSPGSVGGYGYGGYTPPAGDGSVNGNSRGGFRSATPNAKYVLTTVEREAGFGPSRARSSQFRSIGVITPMLCSPI